MHYSNALISYGPMSLNNRGTTANVLLLTIFKSKWFSCLTFRVQFCKSCKLCQETKLNLIVIALVLLVYILGIAVTGASSGGPTADLIDGNQIIDYSFVAQPFSLDSLNVILRCASGLGTSGTDPNTVLGGWYFSGSQIFVGTDCSGPVFEVRAARGRDFPGVINLYLCDTFTTIEEGVYSCIMMNSSMMNQTMRVGVYFGGRSESLDIYPHYLIVNHLLSLYTAAPMIDPPSSSTVTVIVGSPLTLSCTSRGSPPDTFTWRKDSGPIVQSTSITTVTHTNTSAVFHANYSISNVTTSDAGTYTCTVTNPIGSSSETITVNIVGKLLKI